MSDNRNKLWESHRVYLPQMRNRAVHKCKDCVFFVKIQGKRELKNACIANIKRYRHGKTVPFQMPVKEVIKWVGLEGLNECIKYNDPEATACELFRHR